jgi:hypothetical protein
VVAVEVVDFECPFCDGRVRAPTPEQTERTPTARAFVMHTEPVCAVFDANDPLAFLEKVNDATSGKGSRAVS